MPSPRASHIVGALDGRGRLLKVVYAHMGSFDYQCGVSGLPIGGGDPVRFMLVTQNHSKYPNNRSEQLWKLRTVPIKAVYNDYGSVEGLEPGIGLDLMLEGLRSDVVPRDQGENPCHDVPIIPETMTLEEWLNALWENRVLAKPRMGHDPALVKTLMVREDVWQELLKLPTENPFSGKTLKATHFLNEVYRLVDQPYFTPLLNKDSIVQNLEIHDLYHKPLGSLGFWDEGGLGIVGHWKMFRNRNLEPTLEGVVFLDAVGELAHIAALLSMFGHRWLPSTTYGTQIGEHEPHAKYLKSMAKLATKLAKAQKAEWDQ